MKSPTLFHRTLTLRGLVQGVGYRPFVRREALRRGITGRVRNIGGGVTLSAYGTKEALDDLFQCLLSFPPAGTLYLEQEISDDVPCAPADAPADFAVAPSRTGDLLPLLPPDIAPCEDCIREMRDPADRRYRYPFQSCALCGPRYSILSALPYDREHTAMAPFSLCPACNGEYHHPADRRSHGQTVACKSCGPGLAFYGAGCRKDPLTDEDALSAALDALRRGEIVAVKNNGGFHLACLADDAAAIARLRGLKGREEKPFALLFADLAAVEAVADLTPAEAELLTSPARPIVLLRPKDGAHYAAARGESLQLGAMLPSTPLQVLLAETGVPVMTSANPSGEPIYTEDAPLMDWLGSEAAILTHDRAILTPQDDSLLFVEQEKPCFLRRARGYAPLPIPVTAEAAVPTLAMGGDLKAVFALQRGRYVYLSQHIGDLADLPTRRVYDDLQSHLCRLLDITPARLAADAHPGYFSRQAAEASGLPLLTVQHHHAHVASVMAEHGLTRALGLALDGTGYGTDGTVWGGELLYCRDAHMERAAHLMPLPMPGGDEGVIDTLRLARFHLAAATEPEGDAEQLIAAAIRAGLSVPTSSMGRLFDAASAILGICYENTYEGRAAILLENAATLWKGEPARLTLPVEGAIWRSDLLLCALRAQKRAGVPTGALALGFHHAIADALCASALAASKEYHCTDIALSGGCMANRLLVSLLRRELEGAGLSVYRNEKVPVGDGGIALGQAYLAALGEGK